jgi:hypothetical protein
MELAKTALSDYIIQSITFSVIPLSGAHCIIFWESDAIGLKPDA